MPSSVMVTGSWKESLTISFALPLPRAASSEGTASGKLGNRWQAVNLKLLIAVPGVRHLRNAD